MPLYFLSPRGLGQFREFYRSVARRITPDTATEWYKLYDELPYKADLAPWLDGLCRIQIPADITKSGHVEEWTFSPDLVEVYSDEEARHVPKTDQEAIDRVYYYGGTLD